MKRLKIIVIRYFIALFLALIILMNLPFGYLAWAHDKMAFWFFKHERIMFSHVIPLDFLRRPEIYDGHCVPLRGQLQLMGEDYVLFPFNRDYELRAKSRGIKLNFGTQWQLKIPWGGPMDHVGKQVTVMGLFERGKSHADQVYFGQFSSVFAIENAGVTTREWIKEDFGYDCQYVDRRW